MTDETTTILRRCIGSARYGIEPHDAPVEEFPKQPSQRDGLGRMCRTHWNQYTAGLARDAKARKAAATGHVATMEVTDQDAPEGEQPAAAPEPTQRRSRRASPPESVTTDEVAAE